MVGSFDVLIARGGHQTNETMKVLTLVSVVLLPGALIAIAPLTLLIKATTVDLTPSNGPAVGSPLPPRRGHIRPRSSCFLASNSAWVSAPC